MNAEGLHEIAAEFDRAGDRAYAETMSVLWDAADRGAELAAAAVRHRSGETAESISPATYPFPYGTRDGVRSVWGPTTIAGRLLETGTVKMSPHPYLDATLDAVAPEAIRELSKRVAP